MHVYKFVKAGVLLTFLVSSTACNRKVSVTERVTTASKGQVLNTNKVSAEGAPDDIAFVANHINDYELYKAEMYELFDKSKLFFVSVSDRYPFSEHPDSLNIPEEVFKGKTAGEAPHIPIEGVYRKRLMKRVGIKETDSVFVYNYVTDVLKAYAVKNLKTSAVINIYSSEDEAVEQHYYMIGFELPNPGTRKFEETDNLVYIGAQNVFARGQMKAIHWTDTGKKKFPTHTCKAEKRRRDNIRLENVYYYTQDGFKYYAQETLFDDTVQNYTDIKILHVLVTDRQNNIVADLYIEQSEGESPATMNHFSKVSNEASVSQYTGRLIKGEPLVILGVVWSSFGCEPIYFLNSKQSSMYVNCDNRH